MMTVILRIEDQNSIDQIKAAGAQDLLHSHFPHMMGVRPKSITIRDITPEQAALRAKGESYREWQDDASV